MADDDVWSAGEVAQGSNPTFGDADYEQAVEANEAFAVDAVFKYGIGILQEQPTVALLGGVNILGLAFIGAGLGFGINMALTGMAVSGQIDQQVSEVLNQLSSLAVQMILWPFNQLVVAGLMVAAALWIRSEVASVGALYGSVAAAVRGLLAGLVAGVGALTLVLLMPAVLGAVYFVQAGDYTTAAGLGLVLVLPVLPVVIYVALGLMLAPYAAVLDHLGPIEAVQRSWQMADGLRLTLFVTNFVFGLLGGFSMCLCYLPLIVVMPIQIMGFSASYLRASRSLSVTDEWAFFQRHK